MKTPKTSKRQKPNNNRLRPCFRASLTPGAGELEILIYDQIGEYFDWDTYEMAGITSKSVRAALDNAGSFSRIKLRINSPGGDLFEGVAIGNILKSTGKPIDVVIDAVAASAASVVAMCGTTITMASNAMMMIHQAWSICVGNSDDMRKEADILDAIDKGAVAQTYADRTGASLEDILALLKNETWLSARDCVEKGFATAIAAAANEPAMNMAKNFSAFAKMKNAPEAFRRAAALPPAARNDDGDVEDECECECPECTSGDCANCSNAKCEDPDCVDCPNQGEAAAKARLQAAVQANAQAKAQAEIDLCDVTAVASRAKASLLAA